MTLQLPIIEIDSNDEDVTLDNGTPGGWGVDFTNFINGTWYPDTVAQAIIDDLAVGDDYTNGVDTWPVDSINALPVGTVILDDGNPGMLTVPFASFVDGTWTLVP